MATGIPSQVFQQVDATRAQLDHMKVSRSEVVDAADHLFRLMENIAGDRARRGFEVTVLMNALERFKRSKDQFVADTARTRELQDKLWELNQEVFELGMNHLRLSELKDVWIGKVIKSHHVVFWRFVALVTVPPATVVIVWMLNLL